MNHQYQQIAAITLSVLIGGGTAMSGPADDSTKDRKAPAPASPQAAAEKPVDDTAKAILGTWTNKAYNGQGRSGRVVYTTGKDGVILYVATDLADGTGTKYPGTVVFHKQWTDDKGCRHASSTVTLDQGFTWKTLSRISADGKTLEVQSGVKTIDPEGPRYSIYHKQD